MVLGDSRIYSGLEPAAASAAGAAALSQRRRAGDDAALLAVFRSGDRSAGAALSAVVIAVDTYADDDSAIGSLDGDDRPMDLRYVVFQTRLTDLPKLAGSFSDPRERVENGIDLFWRGPNCATTFRHSSPIRSRVPALERRRNAPAYDPLAAHPRSETLAGLHVDFATNAIAYPPGISDARARDRNASARGCQAEPLVCALPAQWLAPIVARYAAAGTPVFFVRIPTRPAHRAPSQTPSGSLVEIARKTARG